MHWRALSAFWLLLLISTLVATQDNALASSTTVIAASNTDGRKVVGGATTLQPTAVLAAATAEAEDATDVDGSPTILSASSSTSSTSSTPSTPSTGVTVHKPQTISTAVGGVHPNTGALSHTRTVTAANSTKTFVFSFHPHTQSFRPPPPTTTPTPEADSTSSGSHIHQSTVAIVFEVIGGLAGLLLCGCCTRCIINYKRMPRRDRIAAVVDRHMLERELAEMEEARPRMFRGEVLVPPPPPYQNAPDYEEVVRADSPCSNPESTTHRPP